MLLQLEAITGLTEEAPSIWNNMGLKLEELVQLLLSYDNTTADFEFTYSTPEYNTTLDRFKEGTRTHDVVLIGNSLKGEPLLVLTLR